MQTVPRVALFADCFHEVNGAALTCRELVFLPSAGPADHLRSDMPDGLYQKKTNVRFLAAIERTLRQQGVPDFQFVIAGHGSDVDWLKANMRQAAFRSVLEGQALARFYADMDIFVFPSYTDTYGNVIQEAMASGVPCIVTNSGGPKFLVANAENGFICSTEDDFIAAILRLMRDPELRTRMGERARMAACETSWENVFETVYEVYRDATVLAPRRAAYAMGARIEGRGRFQIPSPTSASRIHHADLVSRTRPPPPGVS